jgi:hypothetical protein
MREAGRRGALSIGIANNPDTPLLLEPEHAIYLDTGAEPIAGSTRMNAGTAQRITLNLLSSLVMIRLGRVYRGLMVEVQATNRKLTKRRQDMLTYLTGCTVQQAHAALLRTQGDVKLAALVLHGCGLDDARALLAKAGGRLRAAVDLLDRDLRSFETKSRAHARKARRRTEDVMRSKRELIAPRGDKRYIRRDEKGRIKESDDVSRSLSQDIRRQAKSVAKPGQGDRGDRARTQTKKKK